MKPTALFFSEPQGLALNILESLLVNFCRVKIFTDDIKSWQEKTRHLSASKNLEFLKRKSFSRADKGDYLVYLDLYPENWRVLVGKVKQIAQESGTKGFLITSPGPSSGSRRLLSPKDRIGIIYPGDLYGPRMEFDRRNRTAELISAALAEKKVKLFKGEKIYPTFLVTTARQIVKWLFSFGPIGEEVLVSSRGLPAEDFCLLIRKYQPLFNWVVSGKILPKPELEAISAVWLDDIYSQHLKELFDFYRLARPATERKKKPNQNLFWALAGTALLAVSPLLMFFLSLAFLYFAKNAVLKGNLVLTQRLLAVSQVFALISDRESSLLGRAPLVGRPYQTLASFAYVTVNIDRVGQRTVAVCQNTKALTDKILGQSSYSTRIYSEEIVADLDYIEKTIAFSESEAKAYPRIIENVNLAQIKLLVRELKKMASVLPSLLGESGKKTYLVLFQNNMELRPGGGFIGSFALVSVEAGRLINLTVSDVYSADGQLRGHVEPPVPLKKYLNQANWFLRDSNWDVDFAKNAQKAEWFLDKEIDAAVDGVVAIDLGLVRDLLKATGPIFLGDYQTEITPENLYDKTQAAVEENFFPGSAQKTSFLTALSRAILTKLTDGSVSSFPRLGLVLYQNLTKRHLQLFLHHPTAESALANLGWDGAFSTDYVGTVEANLGVNKANYFIKRQSFLAVSGNLWHLRIIYENKASPALANKGIYKNYFRLVTPSTASGFTATPYVLDAVEQAGRKENGFYFEVLPGEKKEINLYWQQPVEKTISWRKQPGPEGDQATLTVNGRVVYNSSFDQDIRWINTF